MAGDKYYKQAKEEQRKFLESEKKLKEDYKKKIQEEMDAEKYARLFPEDSTREYNPVEHYKDGGLVSRGQGRVIKTKKTKMY
jgi:radical SAM superfamily enzyme with C-terminal helix-hairpin-helix motif